MKPAMKITAKDFGNGVLVKLQNPNTKLFHVEYVETENHPPSYTELCEKTPQWFNMFGVVDSADCVKASVNTAHVNHVQLNMVHRVYYNRDGYIDALHVVNDERILSLKHMRQAIVSSCYEAWDNEDDNNYLYNLETVRLYESFNPSSFENPKELKQKWADLRSRGWR